MELFGVKSILKRFPKGIVALFAGILVFFLKAAVLGAEHGSAEDVKQTHAVLSNATSQIPNGNGKYVVAVRENRKDAVLTNGRYKADHGAAGDLKHALLNHAGQLHVPFVANQGQIPDSNVRFYARTFGGTVYVLQSGEVVYALPKYDQNSKFQIPNSNAQNAESAFAETASADKSEIQNPKWSGMAVLKETFAGARGATPTGDRPADVVVNYFTGNDPSRWQVNLPAFEMVNLGDVYDGIQLGLRAYGNNVEKIFTVSPGADPLQIQISLEGAEALEVNEWGELEVITRLGVVRFSAPKAWQTDPPSVAGLLRRTGASGRISSVPIAYVVEENAFSFALGVYDHERPLMIDPMLASTFVGGSGGDYIQAVAVDAGSNIYVAGYTDSINFPTNNAYQIGRSGGLDAFVSKFDFRLTNLLASTYLGGSTNDAATALAIDASGNVFVAGYTESSNFPVINAYQETFGGGVRDAFIARLNAGLSSLAASTFVGGSGADAANALAIDRSDNIFLAGYTESSDFPVSASGYSTNYSGARDGFVLKLNNALSGLSGGTYLGGVAEDGANAMALSQGTNVFVAGYTWSANFPVTNSVYTNAAYTNFAGSSDAFVSRLNNTLTNLERSTFIGGTNQDGANAIGLDNFTNVYVAGYTWSTNFPITIANAASSNLAGDCDVFVGRLTPALTNMPASTYLGGTGIDIACGLAMAIHIVTNTTNVIIVGYTTSTNFPTTTNAYDRTLNGGEDAFAAVLTAPLTNRYAVTYLGGANNDRGLAVAVGRESNSVIAVGFTASSDYPISDATYSTRYNQGAYDGFISRLAGTLTYGTKKWEFVTMNDIQASPAMGPDGKIYIGSRDNKLYAVNPEDGSTNWTFSATDWIDGSPTVGTNGIVYVGSWNSYLYAINSTNGGCIRSNVFGQINTCPAIDADGYLYIGTFNSPNRFFRVNPDLTTNRVFFSEQVDRSSAALGANNDVYVGSTPAFYCLNTLTGATNGMVTDNNAKFVSSPAVSTNGRIYLGLTVSNKVYEINPNGTTNRVWMTAGGVTSSPAISSNGLIYVGASTYLYAFNPDGTTQRVWATGAAIESSPALGANGTIYVAGGNYLYSFNPDGTTNWSFYMAGNSRVSSPLIGMDGTIYIGSADDKLYAVYGNEAPALSSPWHKFHHDMMNSGRLGLDHSPLAPTGLSASKGAYSNRVLVAWTPSQYATVYEVYRSTTNDTNTASEIASTGYTNYMDAIDVTLGQIYYYWVKAKAPLGISGFSGSDYGGVVPLPPTGLSASKGGGGYTNAILVAWNSSWGATGYQVWRGSTNDTNSAVPIDTTSLTNYTDTNITLGWRYYYWVKATNIFGSSGFSGYDYGGTPPLPPTALSAGKGVSYEYVPVTWGVSTGADWYVLYRNTNDESGSAGVITNTADTSYSDYDVTPCRPFYYWLRATNEFGLSGYSASDYGYTALRPPQSVSASDGEFTNKVHVSWVVGDTTNTTFHLVYRSLTNDPGTAALKVETLYTAPTMTNYDDTEIDRGAMYYYWVRAKNAYGTSEFSQADTGGTIPLAPTGVTASDGTHLDKVQVTWMAVSYTTLYEIYRATDNSSGSASLLTTVGGSVTNYDDTAAEPGIRYYYWLKAMNVYGRSLFSGSDSGWRELSPPTTVAATDGTSTSYVGVTWSVSTNATAYELWRNTGTNSATATKLANHLTTNSTLDTAATAGALYYYWVKAKNASFTSGFSGYDSGYRAIGQVDIGVSDLVFLPTVMAVGGHPEAVSFRIANYGNETMVAPNSWVKSDFYLSSNVVFGDSDDVWIGVCSNSVALSIRTSTNIALIGTRRLLVTVPVVDVGRYYVFVRVRHTLPSTWNDPIPDNNAALRLGETITISPVETTPTVLNDYSGDGRADMAVYHESDGRWYIRTLDGAWIVYGDSWGGPGFEPVVGDFDDNGTADMAVYHEATGYWFIKSVTNQVIAWYQWWGSPGYTPVCGDYDGDRKSDLAVYHESDGYWYIESAAGTQIAWAEWWGAPGYKPIPGDYDGDGKSDLALYHEPDGYWYIESVAGGLIAWATWWGGDGYQAAPGDYDGDGKSDLAVYHEATGYWFIQSVAGRRIAWGEYWGLSDYVPVPGDYDGDGIYDLAVYNETTGLWYIRTLTGVSIAFGESWGATGYKPVSNLP